MFNVFSNACKFNKPNGTIRINFSVFKIDPTTLGTKPKFKIVTEISDTGQGMTEE